MAVGVFIFERDLTAEERPLNTTEYPLVIGYSRKGPFMNAILIDSKDNFYKLFGSRDKSLENTGNWFHFTISKLLDETPVIVVNAPYFGNRTNTPDTSIINIGYNNNHDFTNSSYTFDNGTVNSVSDIKSLMDTQSFWRPSERLAKINYMNPNIYNTPYRIFMIGNFLYSQNTDVTLLIYKKPNPKYKVTIREFVDATGSDLPLFVNPDLYLSDFFVEIIAIEGRWEPSQMKFNPEYRRYVGSHGFKRDMIQQFISRPDVSVLFRASGVLIPDFKDADGSDLSIESVANKYYLYSGQYVFMPTDIIDRYLAYSDKSNQDRQFIDLSDSHYLAYSVDSTAWNSNIVSDDLPIYAIKSRRIIDFLGHVGFYNPIIFLDANNINVDTATDTITIVSNAYKDIKRLYDLGYLNQDDFMIGLADETATDQYSLVASGTQKWFYPVFNINTNSDIEIQLYLDSARTSLLDINTLTNFKGVVFAKSDVVSTTSINLTKYFESVSAFELDRQKISYSSNVITIKFADIQALYSKTTAGQYNIDWNKFKTMIQNMDFVNILYSNTDPSDTDVRIKHFYIVGKQIDDVNQEISLILNQDIMYSQDVSDVVEIALLRDPSVINNQILPFIYSGVNMHNDDVVSKTNFNDWMNWLDSSTNILKSLGNKDLVNVRYVIDAFESIIENGIKSGYFNMIKHNQYALYIVNFPMVDDFVQSTDPVFVDDNGLLRIDYIVGGGNPNIPSTQVFALPSEQYNGIDLASYMAFYFPGFIIKDKGKKIVVPPSPYVGKLFTSKITQQNPFSVIAGRKAQITDPEIVNLEYSLLEDEIGLLNDFGVNSIVKKIGVGVVVYGNKTAYQKYISALNYVHIRETLIEIKYNVRQILEFYLFEFNDAVTRSRVITSIESYLSTLKDQRAITEYRVIFDDSNNPLEDVKQGIANVDIYVSFPYVIKEFRVYVNITDTVDIAELG